MPSPASAAAAAVKTAALPKLRFLTAWFCPYAHRATLALEHHRGRLV
jgi:glutathione S-transferase